MTFSKTKPILPEIWLLSLIAGLPLLSETVYTPSLPELAQYFSISNSLAEYTLTVYLFGFTFGILFWGKCSDKIGRKPCILAGFFVYTIGCFSCYSSHSIEALMLSRFVQAFGGSVGSVLGQAIARDAFQGQALAKVFATVGGALAIFPTIGPVIGGLIAQHFIWTKIFLFLLSWGLFLCLWIFLRLPETHTQEKRQSIPLTSVIFRMLRDRQVIAFSIIVGGCNGISFSYYAEGAFYMMEMLKMTPSAYGATFVALSLSFLIGSVVSKKLQNYYSSLTVLNFGLLTMFVGNGIFAIFTLFTSLISFPNTLLITITISCMMIIYMGISLTTSNALSQALINYKDCIGTASALFGFFYYFLVALLSAGIGYLHNNTLTLMPLYFFTITSVVLAIYRAIIAPINTGNTATISELQG